MYSSRSFWICNIIPVSIRKSENRSRVLVPLTSQNFVDFEDFRELRGFPNVFDFTVISYRCRPLVNIYIFSLLYNSHYCVTTTVRRYKNINKLYYTFIMFANFNTLLVYTYIPRRLINLSILNHARDFYFLDGLRCTRYKIF